MTCMRTMSIVSIQSIVVIQNYLKSELMERGTHDLPFTASPFDLADILLDKKIPALTGQHKVSPDSVVLKPELINR